MELDNENSGVYLGHYKGISIHQFARDLILFGDSRVVEVCDAYKMSAETFTEIIQLPSFKKEMRELRALIEASPNALIQVKARTIVERGLEELQSIMTTADRPADRIKAMELLAKIAGVTGGGKDSDGDSSKPQASGLVLNVQLGPKGLVPPLPDKQRRLRNIDHLTQVINVEK